LRFFILAKFAISKKSNYILLGLKMEKSIKKNHHLFGGINLEG